MISQCFIGSMMPDLASGVQQSATIIEIRAYRGGWQCFEAPGFQPFWIGKGAKEARLAMRKAARDLVVERFACSTPTDQLSA